MSSCNVCVTDYNKTKHKKITCKCGYECCRECIMNYTLNSIKDIHCMSCKIEWTHDILYDMLDKTFINKIYKEHREKILFDKELSLIPASLPELEKRKRKLNLEEQLKEVKGKILELTSLKNNIDSALWRLNNNRQDDNSAEKTKNTDNFKFKCTSENCKGFVNVKNKCVVCEKMSCHKCREILEQDHICDENTVANIIAIKKEAKACPSCSIMISKISGYDQMFCTECHTSFSWKTLEIDTGNIHNPHYFEYMKKLKQNIERNPMDVICGRELDRNFTSVLINSYPVERYRRSERQSVVLYYRVMFDTTYEILREAIHIKSVDLPDFLNNNINNLDRNLDIRLDYISNVITEAQFKGLISRRNKKSIQDKQIGYIVSMYITCLTDILYRLFEMNSTSKRSRNLTLAVRDTNNNKEYLEKHFNLLLEIDKLRIYTNEHLSKIAKNFNNSPYIIPGNIDKVAELRDKYLESFLKT